MVTELEKRKAARFRYLETLYEMVDGSQAFRVDARDVGEKVGLDQDSTKDVLQYLVNEGLVDIQDLDWGICIAHSGIKEYEAALSNPGSSTTYFPPLNVVNNIMNVTGGISGSQIQQSTQGSKQAMTINQDSDIAEIREFIQLVREKLPELDLNEQAKIDVIAEIDTIEAQLRASKPKKTVITVCLHALKDLLFQVAASVVGKLLMDKLSTLV